MQTSIWGWVGFNAIVLAMLALDLGVFHRKSHVVKLREALSWSAVWVALAMGFNLGLLLWAGPKPAMEFLTGYLIEKSLSIDNVFVFAILFTAFQVPRHCEHKLLFWGVFGALLMRATTIFAGVALIARFHWLVYVFGGFLVLTGLKMLQPNPKPADPQSHWLIRVCRRLFRVTTNYHDDRFVIRRENQLWATPLLLVLILVETTDLIFAVDSIPAILAVSSDPFIVYTSNAFAVLGLRALYFALAGMIPKFSCLKYGLAAILAFVGTKMMLVDVAPIPIGVSLAVVACILATSIIVSLRRAKAVDVQQSTMVRLAVETRAVRSESLRNEREPVCHKR